MVKMSDSDEHAKTSSASRDTADTSEQIIFMIDKLPEKEKRRTLQKIQPLMSSTFMEPSLPGTSGQDYEKHASSISKHALDAGDSTIVVKPSPCTAAKLRQFSGTVPIPSGQVDFNTWYRAAARLGKHEELSVDEKLARIHNSLSSPALDMAQTALDSESPESVLQLLRNVYGSVEDPRDLLNDFHTTVMTTKEQPSEYLNRLYLKLQKLKSLDTLETEDASSSLLKQFLYGCSDETLILKLHLEEKENDPPEYGELLLALRKEEAKRQKKYSAHKLAHSYQQSTESESTELIKLKTEVASLQAQLANLSAKQQKSEINHPAKASSSGKQSSSMEATGQRPKRKLRFCFKCGESGHVVWRCNNPPNPDLVCKKFEETRQEN